VVIMPFTLAAAALTGYSLDAAAFPMGVLLFGSVFLLRPPPERAGTLGCQGGIPRRKRLILIARLSHAPCTKRLIIGQVSVCLGCCCGQTDHGKREVPVE